MLLLPFALSLFQVSRYFRRRRNSNGPRPTVWHPALIGFLVGTGLFWIYGLSISPGAFWDDHLRTHLIDRIAHVNPLGYVGYPTRIGLWKEVWENTVYVLLPVGCIAFIDCAIRGVPSGKNRISTTTIRSWLVWVAVTAAVFTIVDWRMTKHLSVLILPLVLVTNLLDEKQYPAQELIPLYHRRWKHELVFDEQKTHQNPKRASKPAHLRSETPRGVVQEIYALSVAHFVVRALMFEAAQPLVLNPNSLSLS